MSYLLYCSSRQHPCPPDNGESGPRCCWCSRPSLSASGLLNRSTYFFCRNTLQPHERVGNCCSRSFNITAKKGALSISSPCLPPITSPATNRTHCANMVDWNSPEELVKDTGRSHTSFRPQSPISHQILQRRLTTSVRSSAYPIVIS